MAEETKVETVEETVETESKPEVKTYSEEEYKALETQLDELKKSVADNEDFKAKWEQSEQARKDFEHRTKVNSFVKSLGLKDDIYEKHVSDIIIEKGLKFEGDKLIGGDDVVSVFKEKYPNAFKSEKPLPEFSVHSSGQEGAGTDEAFIRSVMGIK